VGKKSDSTLTSQQYYFFLNAALILKGVDMSWLTNDAPANAQGFYLQLNINANYLNLTDYILCSMTFPTGWITNPISSAAFVTCSEGLGYSSENNGYYSYSYFPFMDQTALNVTNSNVVYDSTSQTGDIVISFNRTFLPSPDNPQQATLNVGKMTMIGSFGYYNYTEAASA
jgi:hypothetical protein